MKIGVFDSGIGGRSIADRLQADYPHAEILYVDDHSHVPYGNRPHQEIVSLTDVAIQPLLKAQCDVIVLACNTATAAAIDTLRATYATTPFIGLEPMIKPASAMTKSGIIAVCATPATLSSARYKALKDKFAGSLTVIEPDCSTWASMIEHNEIDDKQIASVVESVCEQGADVIVLACTHYHWIKEKITEMARGRATIIDPSEAISRRVSTVLSEKSK